MEVKDETVEKIMAEQTSAVQLCFQAGAHRDFSNTCWTKILLLSFIIFIIKTILETIPKCFVCHKLPNSSAETERHSMPLTF